VPPLEALLTLAQVAELFGVHNRTVHRLVERGELAAVRLGTTLRFDPADVRALIEARKAGRRQPSQPGTKRSPQPTERSSSIVDRVRSLDP